MASMVFTIGGDISDFDAKLDQAMQKAIAASKKVEKGGTDAANGINISTGKARRSLMGLSESLINGASGMDLLAQATLRLGSAVKGGLAIGAIAGIGAGLYHAISESSKEMKDLEKEFRDLGKDPNTNFASLDVLQERLRAIAETAKKANAEMHEGFLKSLTQQMSYASKHHADATRQTGDVSVSGPLIGFSGAGTAKKKQQQIRDDARDKEQSGLDSMAQKEERIATLEQARIEYGEHTANLLRIQSDLEEKIGAIKKRAHDFERGSKTTIDTKAQIDAAENVAKGKVGVELKALDAIARQDAASRELVEVDKRQLGYAVAIAKAKLDAAKAALAEASAEKHGAAVNAVKQAQKDLNEEQRKFGNEERAASLETLGKEAELAGKNATEAVENQRDLAEQASEQQQELADAKKADASALEQMHQDEHLTRLAEIKTERAARIAEYLKTPQQKTQERNEARRQTAAGRVLDSRDAAHAAALAANAPTDFSKAFHPRTIGDFSREHVVGPGDFIPEPRANSRPGGLPSDFQGPRLPVTPAGRKSYKYGEVLPDPHTRSGLLEGPGLGIHSAPEPTPVAPGVDIGKMMDSTRMAANIAKFVEIYGSAT